jgi:hypothetical protein
VVIIEFDAGRRPMSSAVFYRTVLERELSAPRRELFESLRDRNEQIEELYRTFPERRRALRGRGEVGPDERTAAEIQEAEEIRAKAESMEKKVKLLVTLISSVEFFLEAALETEQSALKYEKESYEADDPGESELSRPILELREANIREVRAFLTGR